MKIIFFKKLKTMLKVIELEEKFLEHKKFFNNENVEVILPWIEILDEEIDGEKILRNLERAIRTSYQSFDKVGPDSHYKLLKLILSLKHESTLEHEKVTFKVTTSRGVTHELVRHRLASYTQESTRYVKYGDKNWYKIIYPVHLANKSDEDVKKWYDIQVKIAESYGEMLTSGWQPQEARGILPNDLKTDIVVTMNLRALRHYFRLRCDKAAHSDIRIVAWELMYQLKDIIPLLFDDVVEKFEK